MLTNAIFFGVVNDKIYYDFLVDFRTRYTISVLDMGKYEMLPQFLGDYILTFCKCYIDSR